MIALDPHTFGEVLGDVRTLAEATDSRDAGVDLIADASARIDRVRLAVRGRPPLKVAALEWLDPLYIAGHWTPQLIEYAGGFDVLGLAGEPSERRDWEEIAAAEPDVVLVMQCGYDARAGARGGARIRRSARRRSAPARSSRSTPTPTSRGPARGWSTASSCSPTCCIRMRSRRRPSEPLDGRAVARRRESRRRDGRPQHHRKAVSAPPGSHWTYRNAPVYSRKMLPIRNSRALAAAAATALLLVAAPSAMAARGSLSGSISPNKGPIGSPINLLDRRRARPRRRPTESAGRSSKIELFFPPNARTNGAKFPYCAPATINARRSFSGCPKGSKIGSGKLRRRRPGRAGDRTSPATSTIFNGKGGKSVTINIEAHNPVEIFEAFTATLVEDQGQIRLPPHRQRSRRRCRRSTTAGSPRCADSSTIDLRHLERTSVHRVDDALPEEPERADRRPDSAS